MIRVITNITIFIIIVPLVWQVCTISDSNLFLSSDYAGAMDRPRIVYALKPNQGSPQLIMAVWEDGVVLMRRHIENLSSEMVLAQVNPEQVRVALERMDKAGFFDDSGIAVYTPGSHFYTIDVKHNGKSHAYWWDQDVLAAIGLTEFMDVWMKSRSILLQIVPESARPLSDEIGHGEQFRGFSESDREFWFRWKL